MMSLHAISHKDIKSPTPPPRFGPMDNDLVDEWAPEFLGAKFSTEERNYFTLVVRYPMQMDPGKNRRALTLASDGFHRPCR